MSQPLTQDISKPFDPTGYSSISGSQLAQLIDGASPADDKGFVVVTDDVAGNPQVPNANTTTKWQNYIWKRVSATTISLYAWNTNGGSDVTLLQWIPVTVAGIAAGSIVNSMIADNTIQSAKIVSLDWSKISGAPTGLPPSGDAGGDLTGTYPNPTIAAISVTGDKIANLAVTNAKIADTAIEIGKLAPVSGSAKDMARVNAGATGMEAFTPPGIFTSGIVVETGNALKVPRVNAAANAWEMVSATSGVGRILQIIETQDSTADTTALTCSSSTLPTTSNTKQPAGLTAAITPVSDSSTLLVEVGMTLQIATYGVVALFQDAGTDAISASLTRAGGSGSDVVFTALRYKVVSGSTTARTFKTGFSGSSGNTRYNSTDGATKPFGGTLGVNSWIRVTEYL